MFAANLTSTAFSRKIALRHVTSIWSIRANALTLTAQSAVHPRNNAHQCQQVEPNIRRRDVCPWFLRNQGLHCHEAIPQHQQQQSLQKRIIHPQAISIYQVNNLELRHGFSLGRHCFRYFSSGRKQRQRQQATKKSKKQKSHANASTKSPEIAKKWKQDNEDDWVHVLWNAMKHTKNGKPFVLTHKIFFKRKLNLLEETAAASSSQNQHQQNKNQQNQQEEERNQRKLFLVLLIMERVLLWLLLCALIPFLTCDFWFPQGPSMIPTIHSYGDVLIGNYISRHVFGPEVAFQLGDLVFLVNPENQNEAILKRIVAVAGDRVNARGGVLGVIPVEKMTALTPSSQQNGNTSNMANEFIVIPPHHVWIEGDNPLFSRDSRHFGPVPTNQLMGKAIARIWPLDGAMRFQTQRPDPPSFEDMAEMGSVVVTKGDTT